MFLNFVRHIFNREKYSEILKTEKIYFCYSAFPKAFQIDKTSLHYAKKFFNKTFDILGDKKTLK